MIDISCRRIPPSPRLEANSIQVPFGNHEIRINDGPSALGYIFSVAQTPIGDVVNRTYDGYALPLLAIYCRCLYLAYIFEAPGDPPSNTQIGKVPYMSCAMYFTSGNDFNLLLGSTYMTGFDSDAALAVSANEKQRLMNAWRGEKILRPALISYPLPRTLPPEGHFLEPLLEIEVAKCILRSLQGLSLGLGGAVPSNVPNYPLAQGKDAWVTVNEKDAQEQFGKAAESLKDIYKIHCQATGMLEIPITPALRKDILDGPLSDQLLNAAIQVFQIRWHPKYDRQDNAIDAATDQAYRRIFDILFVPRMFPAFPDTKNVTADLRRAEITPTIVVEFDQICNNVWNKLWTKDSKTRILDMLTRIFTWVQNGDDNLGYAGPGIQRYGRCAETHPLAALM